MSIWLIIKDEKYRRAVLCQHIKMTTPEINRTPDKHLYYYEVGNDCSTFFCTSKHHDVDRIFDAVEAAIKSGRGYVSITLEDYRRSDK